MGSYSDRPLYKKAGGEMYLYFNPRMQGWMVGAEVCMMIYYFKRKKERERERERERMVGTEVCMFIISKDTFNLARKCH